ncbi:MAG: hypothetical protein ACYTXT_38030 [Nostoc sp.]
MFQNKQVEIKFDPTEQNENRINKIRNALIENGVPSRHKLVLKKTGFTDLEYGGEEDLKMADSILIKW